MKAVTAEDSRVGEIREAVNVYGRWTSDMERLVVEALDSAFEAGLASAGTGKCRFRVLRWVINHTDEPGWTHEQIAAACSTTRETATRHLCALRSEGMLAGGGAQIGYHLTAQGYAYAAKMDHTAMRGEHRAPAYAGAGGR